jgi:TRAP-type uncharacterized transport system fused permease subunit
MSAYRAVRSITALVAVAMSVYHLTIAFIGAPQQFFFRSTHLLFALVLVFLMYPTFRGTAAGAQEHAKSDAGTPVPEGAGASWIDVLFIAASCVTIGYIWVSHEHLLTRFVFVEDPTPTELVLGTVFTLIVLEATRRVIGWALPVTAVIFLGYALFDRQYAAAADDRDHVHHHRGHLRSDARRIGCLRDHCSCCSAPSWSAPAWGGSSWTSRSRSRATPRADPARSRS